MKVINGNNSIWLGRGEANVARAGGSGHWSHHTLNDSHSVGCEVLIRFQGYQKAENLQAAMNLLYLRAQ